MECGKSYLQFRRIHFIMNNKLIDIDLWNGPGQEKFRSLLKIQAKESDIIIFVYDISNKNSFDYLNERIDIVKNSCTEFQGVIVGNKSDLFMDEKVPEEEGIEFAKKMNYKFYSSSAKNDPQGFINFIEDLIKDFIANKYNIKIE